MTRAVVSCTWDDVPHLSAKAKADLLASIPPHLRDARSKGVPALGSGAIYPVAEADLLEDPFELPPYWPRAYGLDVGWNRTAAAWGAWDRETDTLHVYAEHYVGQAEPALHAAAIRAKGLWVPGVIDPAARGRAQHDGTQLLARYADQGLNLSIADNGVESGIFEVWTRMTSGRLRIWRTCQNLVGELRLYRRDERGRVVKEHDHLMDALRYLCVSGLAVAQVPPDAARRMAQQLHGASHGPRAASSYDPFSAL